MPHHEIEIPKEIREFMPDAAEETVLGDPRGGRRQYRYGNLHIREYDDKFLVHTDAVDPRKDPIGHLLHDAPEVLAGLGCATVLGACTAKAVRVGNPLVSGLVAGAAFGWLGYMAAKKLREGRHAGS